MGDQVMFLEVFYRTRNKMISANKVDTSSSPASDDDGVATSSLASGEGEAVCYLCLDVDGGADEADPLRRDCACCGTDAGFVHLSCLTNYAETKSKQSLDMNQFSDLWANCPSCHQEYQNELSIDIATNLVSFVRRQYPDDTQRQVESLSLKLCAFSSMLNRLQPVQKREAGITANVLLSLIDRMKNESPLTRQCSQIEADAYSTHGCIALDEGTEKSARRAVVHFKMDLKVCKAIGFADGIVNAKRNIAVAKSKYEGGSLPFFDNLLLVLVLLEMSR
jgi:hypothetical protein